MRRPPSISLVCLATAFIAVGAVAAAAQTRIKPGRGSLTIPAQPAPTPASTKTPLPTPASLTPQRLTLAGLPDRTDAAPACRTQCMRTRLTCEANDDNCGPAWNTCLQRCSAAK